jgi:hypothetical protein
VTWLAIACWCGFLVLPPIAPNLPVLCAVLLVFGAAAGMADVTMNAEGVVVEKRLGRPIMSGLHGIWSIGGLVASGVGVAAASVGLDARVHFGLVAVGLLAFVGWVGRGLPADPPPAGAAPPAFALPPRPVLVIGLVAFCSLFGEAAGSDWSAKYLTDVAHAPPGLAAGAYTGFALAMATGRLSGNAVVARLGVVGTVRLAGVVAAAGAALVALVRDPVGAIAGFAVLGAGVAVVIPLAFAAAGSRTAHPGREIAGVATITYGAGLAAPAAIGWVADATSLSVSFAVVAVLCAVMVFGAVTFRPGRSAP